MIEEYKEFRGFGPLFEQKSSSTHEKRKKLIAIDAVLVCF
jgi:hypothetical protein